MKSIFKKYLDFETKHGNEDTVASVKQKALEYVTAKTDVEWVRLLYENKMCKIALE